MTANPKADEMENIHYHVPPRIAPAAAAGNRPPGRCRCHGQTGMTTTTTPLPRRRPQMPGGPATVTTLHYSRLHTIPRITPLCVPRYILITLSLPFIRAAAKSCSSQPRRQPKKSPPVFPPDSGNTLSLGCTYHTLLLASSRKQELGPRRRRSRFAARQTAPGLRRCQLDKSLTLVRG